MSHEESLSSFSDATSSSELLVTHSGGEHTDVASLDCFGALPQLTHDVTQVHLVQRMQSTPIPREGTSFTEMTSQVVSLANDVNMLSELTPSSSGLFRPIPNISWGMAGVSADGFVYPTSLQQSDSSSPIFDEPLTPDSSVGPASPSTRSQRAKAKRKRVITKDQRGAANKRERRRMVTLNDAFDILKERIPTFSHEKKLSRIETLRLAMSYISFMRQMVTAKTPQEFSAGEMSAYSMATSVADVQNVDVKPLLYTTADTRHSTGMPLELSYAMDQNSLASAQAFFHDGAYKTS